MLLQYDLGRRFCSQTTDILIVPNFRAKQEVKKFISAGALDIPDSSHRIQVDTPRSSGRGCIEFAKPSFGAYTPYHGIRRQRSCAPFTNISSLDVDFSLFLILPENDIIWQRPVFIVTAHSDIRNFDVQIAHKCSVSGQYILCSSLERQTTLWALRCPTLAIPASSSPLNSTIRWGLSLFPPRLYSCEYFVDAVRRCSQDQSHQSFWHERCPSDALLSLVQER